MFLRVAAQELFKQSKCLVGEQGASIQILMPRREMEQEGIELTFRH